MLWVYLAFACSGAAALVYETTWTRLLTLYMGHTVAAASSVLAAFMGGLAGGAALGGRLSLRLERAAAIRAYAGLEVFIAAYALGVPLILRCFDPLLSLSYDDGNRPLAFAAVRLGCVLATITPPAIAMGATLPLVVRWAAFSAASAGRDTGRLYGWNTIGAAAGAVLSGFVLLPALGIRATTSIAIVLNLLSAAIGWQLGRRTPPQPAVVHQRPSEKHRRRSAASAGGESWAMAGTASIALALSGCASLILQVAWTRIVALVLGPTTYAFSAMAATFIAGIAIGAVLGGSLAQRSASAVSPLRRRAWALAACLLFSGISATIATSLVPDVALLVAEAAAAPDATFATVTRVQATVLAALMLPMTLGFGAAFPLAIALVTQRDDAVSGDVARLYAANTVGAIAGALAAGLLLVPRLGIQQTVTLAAAFCIGGFVLVAITQTRSRRGLMTATAGFGAAAVLGITLMPPWNVAMISSGAYKYAAYLEGPYRDALLRAGRLLYYREGAAATVSVRDLVGTRSLAIDGKVDASNGRDMVTQRLLAHLPLLLHPAPRAVGIIGLGSGVTLGSALRHPLERADMLEIAPEVVEASRFFARENHHALDDRRTRLIVADGRSHLRLASQRYDVIISEPSNPWMAGVAALFTREFFEAVRARLTTGGIACQWAHTYDIADEDLRSIVATFVSVFPHASVWLAGEGDVLLLGSLDPLEPRLEHLRAGWQRPGVAADLADVNVQSPESLLALFGASGPALRNYGRDASIQRDDRMSLEFTGPRAIYGRNSGQSAESLQQLAATAVLPAPVQVARAAPHTASELAAIHLRAESFRLAFEGFSRALEQNPRDAAAVDGLLRAAAGARRWIEAEEVLAGLLRRDSGNAGVAIGLSRLIAARGDLLRAGEPLRPLLEQRPPPLAALDQLASIFADAGDEASLAVVVADLHRRSPDSEAGLFYAATIEYLGGRPKEAIAAAERLRQRNPRHARALNLLGAAYGTVGRSDDARRAFEASVAADPRDPGTYVNLGTLALQGGQAEDAASYFADALTIDPASPSARQGLERAMSVLGR